MTGTGLLRAFHIKQVTDLKSYVLEYRFDLFNTMINSR